MADLLPHGPVDRMGIGIDLNGHVWKRYPSGIWWSTAQGEESGCATEDLPLLTPVTNDLRDSVLSLMQYRQRPWRERKPEAPALRQVGEVNAFDMVLRLIDGGEDAV